MINSNLTEEINKTLKSLNFKITNSIDWLSYLQNSRTTFYLKAIEEKNIISNKEEFFSKI